MVGTLARRAWGLGAVLAAAALGSWGGACSQPGAVTTAGAKAAPAMAAALDFDDPATCEGCHEAVVTEWRESMHARAHHDRDPIYGGVRAIRLAKEGPGIAKACATCHTPRYQDRPDDPRAAVGVGCAACHNALVHAPAMALLGPHDLPAGASEAHATGAAPARMKDGTRLCLDCHEELIGKSGVPICTTGPEHAAGGARGTCVSCHMPRVSGPAGAAAERGDHASHTFPGPHRAWLQDDPAPLAAALDLAATFEGSQLVVTVANKTGHAVPTGFPGRLMALTCAGVDAAGAEVWTCPPARLAKVYHDAAGQPTLAPYGVKLASDTRLTPGETRTLRFDVPAAVARVTVTAVARLIPPPMADKLGLTGELEAEPRAFAKVEVVR
jgi:hypothetical protein